MPEVTQRHRVGAGHFGSGEGALHPGFTTFSWPRPSDKGQRWVMFALPAATWAPCQDRARRQVPSCARVLSLAPAALR